MSVLQLRLLMRVHERLKAERGLLHLDIALASACAPWGARDAAQQLATHLQEAIRS